MFGFLRNLVMCTAAGTLLALVFLTPTGAVLGALNGLLVGICICLAERRAQQAEMVLVPSTPIRLIGNC
jgi:hypothetical protein